MYSYAPSFSYSVVFVQLHCMSFALDVFFFLSLLIYLTNSETLKHMNSHSCTLTFTKIITHVHTRTDSYSRPSIFADQLLCVSYVLDMLFCVSLLLSSNSGTLTNTYKLTHIHLHIYFHSHIYSHTHTHT